MDDFPPDVIQLTKNIPKNDKQKNGIYITPSTIINERVKNIMSLKQTNSPSILEPSCGSGQFIDAILQTNNDNITGIEYYKTLYDYSSHKYSNNQNITIIHEDFLNYNTNNKFDFIFGNPPFFNIKKDDVPENFHQYLSGRPNIYIVFIAKCLNILKDDGILSFIIPRNFCNGIYYSKLRKYITEKFTILCIEEIECRFIDTHQKVIWFSIQNKPPTLNDQFTLNINNLIIFNTPEKILRMKELTNGKKTLSDYGYSVKVGKTVWNQVKEHLSKTMNDNMVRLIYDTDLKNDNIEPSNFKNPQKGNFILKNETTTFMPPFILVPRGSKGNTSLNIIIKLLQGNEPVALENHVLFITKTNQSTNIQELETIKQKLENPQTTEFIRLLSNNNMINCSELENIIPI